MDAAEPIPPNVGDRITPELFGMFFNWGLMGSLLVQVYNYYCAFPKDRMVTKSVVYSVFVLELAETGIMTYFAYVIFGAGYGDLAVFDKSALEWVPVVLLPTVIAAIVQSFYAQRLYSFSGSKLAGGFVLVLVLLQFSAGIAQGVISKLAVDRTNLTRRPGALIVWLASTAACDITISLAMTYYLNRSPVMSPRMKSAVARVVRYTLETGGLTAAIAIIQLIVQFALPHHNYFETPAWTLGKLYSNNLLVLLNSRAVTVGGRDYRPSTFPSFVTDEVNFAAANGDREVDTQLEERSGSHRTFKRGDIGKGRVSPTSDEH
ncbi:hypothetical protein FB45DRAFT_966219 [Roridomyces roridus]|uniref:DUF6534 domain-containing protein n=1 Tax=Roridomyces roridus TaxID=1738132 RepID=A0AAD7F8B5_9AGAR|nr:hypothetical protein FB45DRAFT_966219 [Roridomyces roridus]